MQNATAMPYSGQPADYGAMLQHWRRRRMLSQLDLSLDAGVSQRHVSFLESGRARPSREMVLMLAGALDLPLRERNAMLAAAGFAPVFREQGLAGIEAEPVRRALGFMLRQQEPFPGLVIDGHWNLLMANEAAGRLIADFVDLEAFAAAHCGAGPPNILKLTVHPDGLRPWIVNWPELADAMRVRVRREVAVGAPDPALLALMGEVEALMPKAGASREAPIGIEPSPILPLRLRRGDLSLAWFSTVATLGTAMDAALEELRIELFFPADDVTERHAREHRITASWFPSFQ
jgi:transcriptional regulator with XRE-family HTH domain